MRHFVVVVAVLVELETPEVSPGVPLAVAPEVEPGAPMELVPPVLAEPLVLPVPLVPAVLDVSLPAAGGVVVLRSVVVLDVLDDVVGVPVSSRLVQAPRETAATSARAAHEVRDALIRKLLLGMLWTFERTAAAALLAL